MKKSITAIFFLIVPGYLVLSLIVLMVVTGKDHAALLAWYEHRFPGAFSAVEMEEYCKIPGWYAWLGRYRVEWMAVIGGVLAAYLFFARQVWRGCRVLMEEIEWCFLAFSREVGSMGRGESWRLGVLLGGILAYRVYFFFAFPLHTDELCSYLYFARPGWLIAVTSYPIPNNHVLFNAFCAIWAQAPGLSPKLVMRLPSIVGDLCLWLAVYCLIRRWSDPRRAWVVVAGTAFCYLLSYFAIQGRGYEWQEICAVGSALAGRWYVRHSKGGALFVVFCAAGLYINPTFLYHFLALSMMGSWMLFRERVRLAKFWRMPGLTAGLVRFWGMLGVTAGLVFVLYLPVVVASGWGALAGNSYLSGRLTVGQLASRFDEFTFILKDMSYYGRAGMWMILALSAVGLVLYFRGVVRGGGGLVYGYWAWLIVSMGLVTIVQRIYPVERALVYWGLSMNLVFVYFVYELVGRYWPRRAALLIAGFLVVKLGGSLRGVYWPRWAVGQRKEVVATRAIQADLQALEALHPRSWQILHSDDYYPMYLQGWLAGREDGGEVIFNRREMVGDVVFVPGRWRGIVNADGRYRLWAADRLTEFGMPLYIYVRK